MPCHKLYNFLRVKCPSIRLEQCEAFGNVSLPHRDVEEFDANDGYELTFFYKILNLYCNRLHSYIPIVEKVWQSNSVFYLQTSTTEHMCTFDQIIRNSRKTIVINILIELGVVLNIIHGMGVSHGFINEKSVFLDDKTLGRVVLRNFVGYNNSNYNFQQEKRKDIKDYVDLINRVFKTARINTSYINNNDAVNSAVESLRALLWRGIIEQECSFNDWHKAICQRALTLLEMKCIYIDCASPQALEASMLSAFTQLTKSKTMLPLFLDQTRKERGLSATIPVVHRILDYLITTGHFVRRQSAAAELIPNKTIPLLSENAKKSYVMAGYLLAYMFFTKIPINCLFSETVINFIMSTSLDSLWFVDTQERQQVFECKDQMCLMRVGARKLTDIVFGDNSADGAYSKLVFDYFYNTQYTQTTLPMLSEDNYVFDSDVTESERFMFMNWVKGLCLDMDKCATFTLLLTNCNYVYKSASTKVIVRKTDTYSGCRISTCESSITIPQAWFIKDNGKFNELIDSFMTSDDKMQLIFNSE